MKLKRTLGLADLIFFGIGAVIGTGVFVMPAIAAGIADVGSFWVWLEVGILTIFMALCLAELSSIYPHAGGPYQFVKEAFGKRVGFLSGWLAWLISWVTIASLAVAVSYYLQYFVHLSHMQSIAIAIGVLALITAFNYNGLHWGMKAQYLLTSISILVFWFFITWGMHFIDLSNFTPNVNITISSLALASVLIIEPFIGWEAITYFAEEAKFPRRDIPRAIVYSSIFVTILYCAVIFVTLGIIQTMHLKTSLYPIALAAEAFLGAPGGIIIAVGAIIVLLGCLNSWVVATARLPYALARDGLFPKALMRIHKKNATPHIALILQFVFASAAVFLAGFEEIIYILVALAMMMYLMMFMSMPIHRKKGLKISYKLPFGYLVPGIASLLAISMLLLVEPIYLLVAVAMFGSGVIFDYVFQAFGNKA
ncbi:MAG: amino acid permease [archaeon]